MSASISRELATNIRIENEYHEFVCEDFQPDDTDEDIVCHEFFPDFQTFLGMSEDTL